MAQAVGLGVSGFAQVFCVHDRQKRVVVTESQVATLGLEVGHIYDPKQHRVWNCACCQNLFVDPSDEPRYCPVCSRPPTFALGGPLAPPSDTPL